MNLSKLLKKEVIFIILSIVAILIVFLGISYAFLASDSTGSSNGMTVSSSVRQLRIIDVQNINASSVEAGYSGTKVIQVQNISNETKNYNLYWDGYSNSAEFYMSATCSSVQSTCSNIPPTSLSTSLTGRVEIVSNVSILAGDTHTYTITISLPSASSLTLDYESTRSLQGTIKLEEFKPHFEYTGSTYESMPIVRAIDNPTEEFYDITNVVNYSSLDSSFKELINYDASKSILLARYNLSKTTGLQTTSTTQSDYAVPFSGSSNTRGYWDPDGSGIDSKYGTYTNYANNIYDNTTYVTAPNYSVAFKDNAGNANYSIAYYVENYVSSLGVDAEGRLLTYLEVNTMTANQRNNGQYYWLGSAFSSNGVWSVVFSGFIIGGGFDGASYGGVRPVVVVSTSDIQ